MIISENLGDSNWIAITTNTRKTPVIRAPPKAPISLPMLSSMAFGAISTSFGIFQLRTNSFTSFSAVFLYSDCGSIVIDTWYCLFLRWICCGLSSQWIVARSSRGRVVPVAVVIIIPCSLSMLSYLSASNSTLTSVSSPFTRTVVALIPLKLLQIRDPMDAGVRPSACAKTGSTFTLITGAAFSIEECTCITSSLLRSSSTSSSEAFFKAS